MEVWAINQINLGNTSYIPLKTMINEGIAIKGLAEVISNWNKIPMKDNIYNRTNRWFKTRRIITGFNQPSLIDHFKVEAQISWPYMKYHTD